MTTTSPPPIRLIPVFSCPYCGAKALRLPYPPAFVGQYIDVYRCGKCFKHFGPPLQLLSVKRDEKVNND